MYIRIAGFGGIAPKQNPRFLPDTAAQKALNINTIVPGTLQPLHEPGARVKAATAGVKTIWRANEDHVATDDKFWVWSGHDVDFQRGFVRDSEEQPVYWTDNTAADLLGADPGFDLRRGPRMSWGINTGPNDEDSTPVGAEPPGYKRSFNLGVPTPDVAPSVSVTAATVDTDEKTAFYPFYTFTYVWEPSYTEGQATSRMGVEMESQPAPPSSSFAKEVFYGAGQTITVDTLVSAAPSKEMLAGDVKKRIYRAIGGIWAQVGEIPLTQQSFVDTYPTEVEDPEEAGVDNTIGRELRSAEWNPPPYNLKNLTNMSNGVMAGSVGRVVYLSESYEPHAWPLGGEYTLDSPVVALAALDTTLVALTRDEPVFLQGSSPYDIRVSRTGIPQGCVSKRSVAVVNGEVWYISPDGIVATSPSGSRLITEGLFSYRQWREFFAPDSTATDAIENMAETVGVYHDMRYYGFAPQGAFIFDIANNTFTTTDVKATAAYADRRTDSLVLVQDGETDIKEWNMGDKALTTQYVSRVYTMTRPINFGWCQVEAESYGALDTIICRIRADGKLIHTQTVKGREPFRLPGHNQYRDWVIEIDTNVSVFKVVMAQSQEEMASG